MADPLDVTSQENVLPVDKPEPMSVTIDRALTTRETPPPTPARSTEVSTTTPTDPAVAPGDRPRDQFGRFAPFEPGTSAPRKGFDGFPTPASTPGTPAPAAPAPDDVVPQSWKPEMHAAWTALPPPVKAYMHQRERELRAGFETIHQRVEISKAILNEFTPYAAALEQEGATPITAIRTLLQTAHALRSAGPEYRKAIILALSQQYGVDLSQPLNIELAQAQAEAGNLQIDRMYQMSGQTNQMQQEVLRQFNAFAADPANEFFPQVRAIMGKMIETGAVTSMKDAYDNAVWLHPGVRKTLLERETQRKGEEQQRASAANLSVNGAPSGPAMVPAKAGHTGLRDTIAAAFGSTEGERV